MDTYTVVLGFDPNFEGRVPVEGASLEASSFEDAESKFKSMGYDEFYTVARTYSVD